MIISLEIRLPSTAPYPFRFEGKMFMIGRDPECKLNFTDQAGGTVSSRHARIEVDGGQVYVSDLGSSNGTFVNGNRIAEKAPLHVGDKIGLGQQGPELTVIEVESRGEENQSDDERNKGPLGFLKPESEIVSEAGADPQGSIPASLLSEEGGFVAARDGADDAANVPSAEPARRGSTRSLLINMNRSLQRRWIVASVIGGVLFVALLLVALTLRFGGPERDLRRLIKRVGHSVVEVKVSGKNADGDDVSWIGSGFVLDDAMTIVTNYHVIERANSATVVFLNGNTVDVDGFVAVSRGKDIVLLRVKPPQRRVRALPLTARYPDPGDTVVAFGSPEGLRGSVSTGIVSKIRGGDELADVMTLGPIDVYRDRLRYDDDAIWIETTARILHGNSGGPLVNMRGEVVGVNTWTPPKVERSSGGELTISTFETLGFASSSQNIRNLQETITGGVRPLSELP